MENCGERWPMSFVSPNGDPAFEIEHWLDMGVRRLHDPDLPKFT
jgi:hypothetical protein